MMKTFFIGVARLHRLNNLIINNILLSWLGFLLSNKPDLSTMTPTEVPDFIVYVALRPLPLHKKYFLSNGVLVGHFRIVVRVNLAQRS
jgi:hypothetical protein